MAALNEVKFNIRHHILMMDRFTVPLLQSITGLNRYSIHSELRRMEGEGILERIGLETNLEESTGGRPSTLYRLVQDPKKRLKVLETVEAFYISQDENEKANTYPESKHYLIAKSEIDQISLIFPEIIEHEKADRLKEILDRLTYARQEEEVGENVINLKNASIIFLEARARYFLSGDRKKIIKMLSETKRICTQIKASEQVSEINSFVEYVVNNNLIEIRANKGQRSHIKNLLKEMHIIEGIFDDLLSVKLATELAEDIIEHSQEKEIEQRIQEQWQNISSEIKSWQIELNDLVSIPLLPVLVDMLAIQAKTVRNISTLSGKEVRRRNFEKLYKDLQGEKHALIHESSFIMENRDRSLKG